MKKIVIIFLIALVVFTLYRTYAGNDDKSEIKKESFAETIGNNELKYVAPPNAINGFESNCHYVDGTSLIMTAGDELNVDLFKKIKHPWENVTSVPETLPGKISTSYFLDNTQPLKFSAECCLPPKIGEKTDHVYTQYFGSSTIGGTGCLCMDKTVAESMAYRGGNKY